MLKHANDISKGNYKCKYYDESNIDSLVKQHHASALKATHTNISSIAKNGLDLATYLTSLKINFDIIMLTETRQTTVGIIEFYFPEYEIYLDNPNTIKGGACILIRKDTFKNVKQIKDNKLNLKNKCKCTNCEIDNVWVSLEINNMPAILGCVYRHPKAENGISHFNENLNEAMKSIHDNTLSIIAGDFNINLIKTENANTEQYTNTILQNSFIPCITIPTRVTYHSASIIDHILLKTPRNLIHTKVSAGNLITDISDHLPNILFMDLAIKSINERPLIRLFTPQKISEYLEKSKNEKPLISYENNININDNNLQNTYMELDTNFLELFNKYFPLIRQSRKQFKDKPYVTSGIKESIKSRNALYKAYIANPTEANETIWKQKKNRIVDILRKSESDYYATIINNHAESSKMLWKTMGNILNKTKLNLNLTIMLPLSTTMLITARCCGKPWEIS